MQLDIARTMLAEDSPIVPRVSGAPYFDKPPLPYWVAWPLLRWFPSDPWLARVGSGLASSLEVAVTVLLVHRFGASGQEGERRRLGRAVLVGVILALLPGTAVFARVAVHDSYLTSSIALAMASLYGLAFAPGTSSRLAWRLALLAGVAMGVGFLAKGLLAWALPLALLLVFAALSRQLPRLRRQLPRLAVSAALAVAIPLPWLLAATREAGPAFLSGFLGHSNLERVASTVDHHSGPWYFYLPALLLLSFPWGLLALTSGTLWRQIRSGWRQIGTGKDANAGSVDLPLWSLVWVGLTVLLLSLASTKLPQYILSCLPGVAILVGYALVPLPDTDPRPGPVPETARSPLQGALGVGTAAVLAAAALVPGSWLSALIRTDKLFPSYTEALLTHLNGLPFRLLLFTMAAAMMILLVALPRRRTALVVGWILVALLSYGAVLPGMSAVYRQHRQQAVLDLADQVRGRSPQGAPVVILGKSYHSVALRSGHPIARADSWGELTDLLASSPASLTTHGFVLITPETKQPSPDQLAELNLRVIERARQQNLVALVLGAPR